MALGFDDAEFHKQTCGSSPFGLTCSTVARSL